MSLDNFMQSHLVVLSQATRIYDAVRAMEDNRIGAVLVRDESGLVGIVTDRDVALRVLAQDLDPFEFQLSDVMTWPLATVAPTATVMDVADVMLAHHVRRVPVVDGAAICGLVTLDDLLLEHAVDRNVIAAIVRAQISPPARRAFRPGGTGANGLRDREGSQRRREARRRQTYAALLRRALEATDLTRIDQTERALQLVLAALVRRLTPDEAGDLLAQLPGHLRDHAVANVHAGPDLSVNRGLLERELEQSLGVSPARAAEIVASIGRVLAASISSGELADVRAQLPADMKSILSV
jgi:CBS domain-containing protein/uncharacterized protein (DUF2267 family)